MDHRTYLKKSDRLVFPGLECVIDAPAGRGANILAYTGHYPDQQDPAVSHRVLIRELFPCDPGGGIRRLDNGDLFVEKSAGEFYAYHKKTFLRAASIHGRLAERLPSQIEWPVNTFSCHNTLYSLLGYSGGRTLEEEVGKGELSLARADADAGKAILRAAGILRGALNILGSFHEAGFLHLDISPDNILLLGEGEEERATLIDYNSVHTLEEIRREEKIDLSTKEGYTAPEIRLGQRDHIGPAADLYSMTAVFWHCLSEQTLSGLEAVGSRPPDPGSMPGAGHLSETVLSMMRRILKKGLSAAPGRRYQTAREMSADLSELADRINGRGITHWALWENGRARFSRLLKENRNLQFVRDQEKLFPMSLEMEGKRRGDLSVILSEEGRSDAAGPAAAMNNNDEPSLLLLGGGGTGKTTALYRTAWQVCRRYRQYSGDSPAVFYISLYGYRDSGAFFLRDTLLEGMRFQEHTDTLETARRELMQVLDTGAPLLLLIDGLNEAAGETGPLLEELRLLAAKPGVRVLLTGRTAPEDLPFPRAVLCPLDPDEVRAVLSREGVLPPENPDVLRLLAFPVLLSVYLQTTQSREGFPASAGSREELLETYFLTLQKKQAALSEAGLLEEQEALPTASDAVFRFLLPELAAQIKKSGRPLGKGELLPVVEKCFQELNKRALTAVYPEWIGRSARIRLGCKTADEWFGRAVLDMLWRQSGILVRDEHGRFRILHEILQDYLVQKSLDFHGRFDRIRKRQRDRRAASAVLLFILAVLAFGIYNGRMRAQIAQRHEQMVLTRQKSTVQEWIGQSEQALALWDRKEAVRLARKAVLLEAADTEEAEQILLQEDSSGYHFSELGQEGILSGPATVGSVFSYVNPCVKRDADGNVVEDSLSARAQRALTEALGVYDLAGSYLAEGRLDLPEQPLEVLLSPGGTRLCALFPGKVMVFDNGGIGEGREKPAREISDSVPDKSSQEDFDGGREALSLPVPGTGLAKACFLDEDRIIYTSTEGLCIYDLKKDSSIGLFSDQTEREEGPFVIAVSGDGSRIAAVRDRDRKACLFDSADGRLLKTVSFGERCLKMPYRSVLGDPGDSLLVLNADGTALAAGFADGSVSLFDLETDREYRTKNDTAAEWPADLQNEEHPSSDESSREIHFEGGFCGDLFAWTARENGQTICACARVSTGETVDHFVSEEPVLLYVDENGILIARGQQICRWDPEQSEDPDILDPGADRRLEDTSFEEIGQTEDPVLSLAADEGLIAAGTEGGRLCFFKVLRKGNLTEYKEEVSRNTPFDCTLLAISGDTGMGADRDSASLIILKKRGQGQADLLAYDPGYAHIEARISADKRTAMLFSTSGFEILSLETGALVCDEDLPGRETMYDEQFRRSGDRSWLEVTWYDGKVRSYSAADGQLLLEETKEKPDGTLCEEFLTDRYKITSLPGRPLEITERGTGQPVGTLEADANLAYVSQAGDHMIAEYFDMKDGARFGLLLNEDLELLARLPCLCDLPDQDLVFDCPEGILRRTKIYSLKELMEMAEEF